MSVAAAPPRADRGARAARIAVALFVAVAMTPEWGLPVDAGPDASYLWALSRLDADGAPPGRAWAFPFGPLAARWLPAGGAGGDAALARARPMLLGYTVLLAAALVALAGRGDAGRWSAAALLLLGSHAALVPLPEHHLCVLTLMLVVVAGTSAHGAGAWWAAAGVSAGVACFVKQSAGVVSLAVLFAGVSGLALRRPRRDARSPLLSGLGALTLTLGALAVRSFPTVADLGEWLRCQLEFAVGYSSSMSLGGPGGDLWLAVLAIAIVFGIAGSRWRHASAWAPTTVGLGLSLVLAFKHGYVRSTLEHPWSLVGWGLAIAAALVLTGADRREWRPTAALALALVAAGAVVAGREPGRVPRWVDELSGRAGARRLASFASLARRGHELERESRRELREHRWSDAALGRWRERGGAVDVLPWRLSAVAANGLDWAPLPSLQLYQAYTPWLDARNADHFLAAGSPPRLLVHADPIDGRHPFWEAPATWEALRAAYAPGAIADLPASLMLLERRPALAAAVEIGSAPLQPLRARTWTTVPPAAPGELLLLDLDLRPTLAGRLRELFFRVEPLFLEMDFEGELPNRSFRVLPRLSQGLRCDAAPASLVELADALDGGERPRVLRIRPVARGWSSFRAPVGARVRRLRCEADAGSVVAQRFDRPPGERAQAGGETGGDGEGGHRAGGDQR